MDDLKARLEQALATAAKAQEFTKTKEQVLLDVLRDSLCLCEKKKNLLLSLNQAKCSLLSDE